MMAGAAGAGRPRPRPPAVGRGDRSGRGGAPVGGPGGGAGGGPAAGGVALLPRLLQGPGAAAPPRPPAPRPGLLAPALDAETHRTILGGRQPQFTYIQCCVICFYFVGVCTLSANETAFEFRQRFKASDSEPKENTIPTLLSFSYWKRSMVIFECYRGTRWAEKKPD